MGRWVPRGVLWVPVGLGYVAPEGRLCPNLEALLLATLWPNSTLPTKCSPMGCVEFSNGSMEKLIIQLKRGGNKRSLQGNGFFEVLFL